MLELSQPDESNGNCLEAMDLLLVYSKAIRASESSHSDLAERNRMFGQEVVASILRQDRVPFLQRWLLSSRSRRYGTAGLVRSCSTVSYT